LPLPAAYKEALKIANDVLINEQIREKEVRLIGDDGKQLGIVSTAEALRIAESAGLDLVTISATAVPIVCRLMDYSKYRFEQEKKKKEAKKNQRLITLKEMRLSPTIDTHDMEVKAKNVQKFLADGDKVKVSIRFKGRQIAHAAQGLDVMNKFLAMLSDVVVEKSAKMEGRNLFMVLAPKN